MSYHYKKSIVLFRRDLRLEDHTALREACSKSESIVLLFVVDPRQVDKENNPYFGEYGFGFLMQSLVDLKEEVDEYGGKLHVVEGVGHEIVPEIARSIGAEAVFAHYDYTPFAQKRDKQIEKSLTENNVKWHLSHDYTLSPLDIIRTGQGNVYSVFTPFFKNAREMPVSPPRRFKACELKEEKSVVTIDVTKKFTQACKKKLHIMPGRTGAKKMMKDMSFLATYKNDRDKPAIQGTSQLSAHLKFGTVSIREVFFKADQDPEACGQFIQELYWRDFYMYIAYHFPYVFDKAFLPWARHIAWENDPAHFERWKQGRTGVPIVDAGMRELAETGWMHNRVRMIVASYLTKHLLIDWRWGEKFFAQSLLDYDPASNNGGWQWSASVGADPRPLRIFNPYTQAQKYDPDAAYIKKWVKELKDVDAVLLVDGKEYDFSTYADDYPTPIVEHLFAYHRARDVYKQAHVMQERHEK